MVTRASIEFIPASSPIIDPVTKFGGQPVWLSSPQWPISRELGEPMQFIAQIALGRDLFGSITGRMAYLFMSDWADGTWEPDGGENAIVIQPGDALVPVQEIPEGPTLYRMTAQPNHKRLVQEPCEFSVRLTIGDDPEFKSENACFHWDKETRRAHAKALEGNKIGGTPGFLQNDEFPPGGYEKLLLQLDSCKVPFSINFGDAGIGYGFLSHDGTSAKFLWQCC
jgi:uncharacterized protein YwqG